MSRVPPDIRSTLVTTSTTAGASRTPAEARIVGPQENASSTPTSSNIAAYAMTGSTTAHPSRSAADASWITALPATGSLHAPFARMAIIPTEGAAGSATMIVGPAQDQRRAIA